jgi:hypothetical protein
VFGGFSRLTASVAIVSAKVGGKSGNESQGAGFPFRVRKTGGAPAAKVL